MVYMKSFDPFRDSKDYTMAVNGDRLYVAEKIQDDAYVIEYPLVQGIDLTKPYPPGVRGSSFTASWRPTYYPAAHALRSRALHLRRIDSPEEQRC